MKIETISESYLQVGDTEIRANDIEEYVKEHNNMKKEIERLKHREKELKYFNDILEKQNIEKSKEIEILNTNWEVAKEDLTRIAQLLNLEEGCTIYDIEDKIERLNNIINEAINYIDDNTYYKDHKGHINIDDLYIILQGVGKE